MEMRTAFRRQAAWYSVILGCHKLGRVVHSQVYNFSPSLQAEKRKRLNFIADFTLYQIILFDIISVVFYSQLLRTIFHLYDQFNG